MFFLKLLGIIAAIAIIEALPSTATRKNDFINILARNSKTIIANSKLKFDTPLDEAFKKVNSFVNEHCLPLVQSISTSPIISTFYDINPSHVVSKLGLGFAAGYSSGFFLKRVTNKVIYFLGGTIISLQALSYFGYISVDYRKIRRDISMMLDINADGIADDKDIRLVYEKVQNILFRGIPLGGSFSSGFYLAWNK